MTDASLKTIFILGRGRSGTTWVGRVLDSYARCNYKYEPFNPGKARIYERWLRSLDCGKSDRQLQDEFERILKRCLHNVDYPPFPKGKQCRPQSPALLRLTWNIGRALPFLRWVYEIYGRPRFSEGDAVLIKQVNFPNERLDRLTEVLSPVMIAVLRNPFASVASALRYYEISKEPVKPPEAIQRVRGLLEASEDPSLRRYLDQLNSMSDTTFEALRWRMQSEPLAQFTASYKRGQILLYEQAASDPKSTFESLFHDLGWPFDDRARSAIEAMSSKSQSKGKDKSQFSVYRDRDDSLNKWKRNLTDKQKDQVAQMIVDSPLLHHWPDICAL